MLAILHKPLTREGDAPHGKMCWTYFKTIGHSLKNLSPFQKTLRPPWCPKLVTGLNSYTRSHVVTWRNAIIMK